MSPDGSKIAFRSSERTGFAECVISREALEAHFWLPPGADEVRTLKTFADGRERIIAVAERKMRARGPISRSDSQAMISSRSARQ
ncbi:DUF1488 family protein [Paraburkholderia elongata]|uniref:DUF1488 family protein n=1 Tax=Paraburkholderia elongata TaxID=2675747 RepID=UPI002E2A1984|nr:DUF1488 family protein [Paraburkholderia elongata]